MSYSKQGTEENISTPSPLLVSSPSFCVLHSQTSFCCTCHSRSDWALWFHFTALSLPLPSPVSRMIHGLAVSLQCDGLWNHLEVWVLIRCRYHSHLPPDYLHKSYYLSYFTHLISQIYSLMGHQLLLTTLHTHGLSDVWVMFFQMSPDNSQKWRLEWRIIQTFSAQLVSHLSCPHKRFALKVTKCSTLNHSHAVGKLEQNT